jgi:hypothetical protein
MDCWEVCCPSLNTATFVFKQDQDMGLVRRFQSPIVIDGRLFVVGRRRAIRVRRKMKLEKRDIMKLSKVNEVSYCEHLQIAKAFRH